VLRKAPETAPRAASGELVRFGKKTLKNP